MNVHCILGRQISQICVCLHSCTFKQIYVFNFTKKYYTWELITFMNYHGINRPWIYKGNYLLHAPSYYLECNVLFSQEETSSCLSQVRENTLVYSVEVFWSSSPLGMHAIIVTNDQCTIQTLTSSTTVPLWSRGMNRKDSPVVKDRYMGQNHSVWFCGFEEVLWPSHFIFSMSAKHKDNNCLPPVNIVIPNFWLTLKNLAILQSEKGQTENSESVRIATELPSPF